MSLTPSTSADAFTRRVPRAAWRIVRRPRARLTTRLFTVPITRLTLAATLALGLNGCAWTLITAADATGSVIQAGYAIASSYSSPTFVNGRPVDLHHLCIEVNPMVSVGDFVPALQVELDKRGVRSDVYNPGTSPANCEARLVYNAAIDYGRRSFSNESIQYLSIIDLTLIRDDHILITARYQTGGLNTDRFSSAAVKLRGLLDKMVVNQLDLGRQTMQTVQNSPTN